MDIKNTSKKSIYGLAALLLVTLSGIWLLDITDGNIRLFVGALLYASLFFIIKYTGLSTKELGLGRHSARRGLIWGLLISLAVLVVVMSTFFIQKDLFFDERYQYSLADLLYKLFFVLPFSTVILEELLFRGVLFGLLLRTFSLKYTVVISSILFGLWHVLSATNFQLDSVTTSPVVVIAVAILATALAGVGFALLRVRTGSLYAPLLVHWTINASSIFFVYLAWL